MRKSSRPVRPAQPAARDLAAAQVHALEARRVDEDLEHRLGLGQPRNLRRIKLERHERTRLAFLIAPPEIGPRHRLDQCQVLPKHAVLGKILDVLEGRLDRPRLLRRAGAGAAAAFGIEAHPEQLDQLARDTGVRRQRRLDERLREREADLAQVFRARPQDHDLLRRKARRDHQAIEVVVLDLAAEDLAERRLEDLVQRIDLDRGVGRGRHQSEVVHPHRRHALGHDAVRPLVEHLQSHVLEHRQAIGQRDRPAQVEKLEAQHAGRGVGRSIQRHRQRLRRRQLRHQRDVGDRGARRKILAVPCGKGARKALEPLAAARLADAFDQRDLEIVVPAPGHRREARLERAHVEGRNLPRRRAHPDHDARQHRFGQVRVELGARSGESLDQDRLPLLAQVGGVVLARHVDQAARRSARTRRGARTSGSAAARQVAGCREPSPEGRPRRSGTARRADRWSGCSPAPSPHGCPARRRRAP